MGYRARPRYEARIQRSDNTPSPGRQAALSMAPEPISSPGRQPALSLAPQPEGRGEPPVVLDALNEMHNEAPRRHA
jgi:hypothetical protein